MNSVTPAAWQTWWRRLRGSEMDLSAHLVTFTLDEHRLAIPIPFVERVVRAAEVTPLGKAPKRIIGVIDYHGDIIPVLNLRNRLGYNDRPVASSDRFMIIQTSIRRMALVVDVILDVMSEGSKRISASDVINESVDAEGITRCSDGLILIYDPEKFLSSTEEAALEKALKTAGKKPTKDD